MTEPIDTEAVEGRETEDLRPVPGDTPGVHWNAMRLALAIVVVGLIAFFVWLALSR
jgi:hypothetical protein